MKSQVIRMLLRPPDPAGSDHEPGAIVAETGAAGEELRAETNELGSASEVDSREPIESLDLRGKQVTDEGVKQLVEALPNCSIRH